MVLQLYNHKISKNGGVLNFEVFRDMVRDLALQFREQEAGGRYYVLLCLEEAEHFRGIMHARRGRPLLPGEGKDKDDRDITCAALWMKGDSEMKLLQASYAYVHAPNLPHLSAMNNSYRFLDSDMYYSDSDLTVLLRVLENNVCEDRKKWFFEIRSCRRRRQNQIGAVIPVYTIFSTPHEYMFIQYKSEVARIQHALSEKGMLVFDAFRAFNSSNSGLLSCSELYGGLTYLGIPFVPDQIYDLVRKLGLEATGLISYQEFKRAFQQSDQELESRGLSQVSGGNFEPVPPKPIPELSETLREAEVDEIAITDKLLQNMKVKLNPVEKFDQVWNSQDTASKRQVSIWAPALETSMFSSNKTRLCVGYYSVVGLNTPSQPKLVGAARYLILEVTDQTKMRVSKSKASVTVINNTFPLPVRFRQVWHFARGNKSLYAWKAQPPEGFLALGMLVTMTDQPPDLSSLHCVPASWCTLAKMAPQKIWDDSGAGGGKPGSIWTINSMDMFYVVPGHDSPAEPAYELKSPRFFMGQFAKLMPDSSIKFS